MINVGVLAHVDAGKTTLIEAILYKTGKLRKTGRVDFGDSFLDNDEYERKRGITIFSKLARTSIDDIDINIIDTPGHVDFSAEMERTISILDMAILVISGSEGVQSHSHTLFRLLREANIPTLIFVNKIDSDKFDKDKILEGLKKSLSKNIVDFSKENKMLLEEVAACDENLIEKFIEGEEITKSDISFCIENSKVFPAVFGSGLKLINIEGILELIKEYVHEKTYSNELSGIIYKIKYDENGNRLSFIKLLGGSLQVKDTLFDEKINQIRAYDGEKYIAIDKALAGDIIAVTGLSKVHAGDTFGDIKRPVQKLLPVLSYNMVFPDDISINQIYPKLLQIFDEIPEIKMEYDEELAKIKVNLMGEVQIDLIKNLIGERLGLNCDFIDGGIIYKETIAGYIEGVGHFEPLRHYAEVHMLISEGERGSGIVFVNEVSDDELPRNYQSQVRNIVETSKFRGVLTGSELTDVVLTLVAGRAHEKHTEGGDFLEAVNRAVRHGLMYAKSILLEPYYDFEINIPMTSLGRLLNDLNNMNAEDISYEGGETLRVTGYAPTVNIQNYGSTLLSYTKGLGQIGFGLRGFLPCHNADKIIESSSYIAEFDTKNTPDSVFCSHGESFIVPWSEVFNYMHLPLKKFELVKEEEKIETVRSTYDATKADSEELMAIFERTYGKVTPRIGDWDAPVKRAPEREYVYKERAKKKHYLLVDGYNIIFASKSLNELAQINIDAARDRLVELLIDYKAYKDYEIIVVFDAYRLVNHPTEVQNFSGVYVVYTKTAETADQYIEKTTHEMIKRYDVTVATSDGIEQVIIRGKGAILISAREFLKDLEETKEAFRKEHIEKTSVTNRLFDSLEGELKEKIENIRLGKKEEP